MAPDITTDRLLLRHWKESDKEHFYEMCSDPAVMEHFPSTLSREVSDDFATRCEKELNEREYGFWAIEIPNVAPFIGFVGLHYRDFPTIAIPVVEIAWRLAKPHWRKGYAFECASRVLEYGLETLKLPQIVAFTAVINEPSIRLMEKLGMKKEHTFEHPLLEEGHRLRKHVLYTINSVKKKEPQ